MKIENRVMSSLKLKIVFICRISFFEWNRRDKCD